METPNQNNTELELYIVITDLSARAFSNKISEKIKEGYEPYGNPFTSGANNYVLNQAMIHQRGIGKCLHNRTRVIPKKSEL